MSNSIIIKPLITEKMTGISEKQNKFGFIVRKQASKPQIIKAIEDIYDVKIIDISTMRYQGKRKSRYTKTGYTSGRKNAYKKAIVTLNEGQTIDFYSNI